MIAHNQRFVRSHEKAREILEKGELGKIYSFRTAFGHPGPETWSADGTNSWFFKKEQAFIGAMGDLGVHKTDLLRFLLEKKSRKSSLLWKRLQKKTLRWMIRPFVF